MQEHDKRIALRLPSEDRTKIEELINEGKFKNISQVIRAALKKFFEVSQ